MRRVLTTNQKGAIAETAVTLEAVRLGIPVLRPVVEGSRYDLVFEIGGRFLRVQCKWATTRGNAVVVRARTSRRGPGGRLIQGTYGRDEIDMVAAYCPENGNCYFIPFSRVPLSGSMYLRLGSARNGQKLGLNWAADYELGAIAQLGERRAGSAKVVGSSPTSSTSEPPSGAALF